MATRRSRFQIKPNLKPTPKTSIANIEIIKKTVIDSTVESIKKPDEIEPIIKKCEQATPPNKATSTDKATPPKATPTDKATPPDSPVKRSRPRLIKPKPKIVERKKKIVEEQFTELPVEIEEPAKPEPELIAPVSPAKPVTTETVAPSLIQEINNEVNAGASTSIEKRPVKIVEKIKKVTERRSLLRPKFGEAPERKKMRMMDLIFYNPVTNPMTQAPPPPSPSTIAPPTPTEADNEEQVDDPTTQQQDVNKEENLPGPRLIIGEDGQITIDESSLVIQQTAPAVDISQQEIVYETSDTSYASFKKPKRSLKTTWTLKETAKFYRALSIVGTDFTLMAHIFPQRSREDLKKKYKMEERTRKILIDKAMTEWHNFDLEDYENFLGHEEIEKIINEADKVIKEKRKRKPKVKKAVTAAMVADAAVAEPSTKQKKKKNRTKAQKERYSLLHPWSSPERSSSSDESDGDISLADTESTTSTLPILTDVEDENNQSGMSISSRRQILLAERKEIRDAIEAENASLEDSRETIKNPTPIRTYSHPPQKRIPFTPPRNMSSPHPTLQAILNEASTALQAQGGLASALQNTSTTPNSTASVNLPHGKLVLLASKTPSNEEVLHVFLVSSPTTTEQQTVAPATEQNSNNLGISRIKSP